MGAVCIHGEYKGRCRDCAEAKADEAKPVDPLRAYVEVIAAETCDLRSTSHGRAVGCGMCHSCRARAALAAAKGGA